MLATVQQVKGALKAAGVELRGTMYERRTWTDKRKAKNAGERERYFVVKFGDSREADRAAKALEELYTLAGVTAKVRRTSAQSDWMTRSSGGEYVRTVAIL
jgi:hypothetical protein